MSCLFESISAVSGINVSIVSSFISKKLNISVNEAKKIQKEYFHKYSTTLSGMMKHHNIDANEFLEFVHDINLDFLKHDKGLEIEISRIKGKKIIFTNGSKAHAKNVTKKLLMYSKKIFIHKIFITPMAMIN